MKRDRFRRVRTESLLDNFAVDSIPPSTLQLIVEKFIEKRDSQNGSKLYHINHYFVLISVKSVQLNEADEADSKE